MLHLDDSARLGMGQSCVVKYFKVIFGLIICQAPSKNAGIELEKRINGAEVLAGKGKYKRGFKYTRR